MKYFIEWTPEVSASWPNSLIEVSSSLTNRAFSFLFLILYKSLLSLLKLIIVFHLFLLTIIIISEND